METDLHTERIHVKMKEEIRVMFLQAKEHQIPSRPLGAGEEIETIHSLTALKRKQLC